jgi:endonuclease/exonuclease/phosphatase family metal-dependent hydrolase
METTGEQNINNERRDNISLLTFNVHAWGDAKHKANFSRVMEILHVLQPDVIGLNEIRGDDSERRAAQQLGEEYTSFQGMIYSSLGNAIITRLPTHSETEDLTKPNNHINELLSAEAGEIRGALRVPISKPQLVGGVQEVISIPLDHLEEPTRLAQWKLLMERIDPQQPHVIMGDFNALCKEDYSRDFMETIANVRKRSCWYVRQKCDADLTRGWPLIL